MMIATTKPRPAAVADEYSCSSTEEEFSVPSLRKTGEEDDNDDLLPSSPTAGTASPRPAPRLRRKATLQDTLNETTAVQRLVEYFVVISSKPRWQPTVDGNASKDDMHASTRTVKHANRKAAENIHMPENKSSDYDTFKPVITGRYPQEDHPDNPLNPMILQFCYPAGDVIMPTSKYEMPKIHHFVLTQGCGRRIYATCLTVLEEFEQSRNELGAEIHYSGDNMSIELSDSRDQSSNQLYLPKILCLISTWPYLTAFREYLSQLYRLVSTTHNVMQIPIERYVMNVTCEIPAPPPGAYEIRTTILNSTIRFWAPPAKLPIAYVALPYRILFECLDLENILEVFAAMVLERKILLVSSQYSILTVCSEILCSLLFPFRWSHLYVPMLPKMLCPMLDAPVPYLCGIVRDNHTYAKQFLSVETIVVDLDFNSVKYGPEVPAIPSPPTKKWIKLRKGLEDAIGDVFWKSRGSEKVYNLLVEEEPQAHKRSYAKLRGKVQSSQWNEKLSTLDHAFNLAYTPESPNLEGSTEAEQSKMDAVQDSFLRFFVSVMKNYRKYLVSPKKSRHLFQTDRFLEGLSVRNDPFTAELTMTQHFDDFITRRMYSPGEPDIKFFEQSIDAKLNRSKLKIRKVETLFLQSAKAHKELTKIEAVPPNDSGLSQYRSPEDDSRPYEYKKLPESFDEYLFCSPRPIPQMISAEFDRQDLLVSKIRAEYDIDAPLHESIHFDEDDFHPSPDVGTFTVIIFVYAAIVGREWQVYTKKRREEDANKDPNDNDTSDHPSTHCCERCPDDSMDMINSTLSYISSTASQAYDSYVNTPVDHYAVLCATEGANAVSVPETEEGAVEYEEAKEIAAAQLDVAFDLLATMQLRGLPVDADVYVSMMEACGRCGNANRALELIQKLKHDGFVADKEMLTGLLVAFMQENGENDVSDAISEDDPARPDAYSRVLKNGFDSLSQRCDLTYEPSDQHSDDISSGSSIRSVGGRLFFDWFYNNPAKKLMDRKLRRKKKKRGNRNLPVTPLVSRHIDLAESLLDLLYPNLEINTNSDNCPDCSHTLTETDVVDGWSPGKFDDYKTCCPKCKHRFVPRFSLSTTAEGFTGSQGVSTPLFCEFLSPWVLRKEFHHIVKSESGIAHMLRPEWRKDGIRAALFWNLIISCRRYRLPFTFLLQGSFGTNRLVLPRGPDEM
jgi:pentatricopeptide repeat protein